MAPSFFGLLSSLLILGATATPLPLPNPLKPVTVTPQQLLTIAPASSSCLDAQYASECRTAAQAAKAISQSFETYHITHPAVAAALVSLIALESGEFKYSTKHYPPTVGTGTRNMQSSKYNDLYGRALGLNVPALLSQGADAIVQKLNSNDTWSFGSAAWFVVSQCPFTIRKAMWGGSEQAWENYLTNCVGTTVSDDRKGYWQKAIKVFGTG